LDKIVKDIVSRYGKLLLKKKNVVGWSGKLKPRLRTIKGKQKRIPRTKCFRVYVTEKVSIKELKNKDVVPPVLVIGDTVIETDVVEIGEMKSLQGRRSRLRPYKAGCSAMECKGTRCTLGWYGVLKEENIFGIVANNHCCARLNKAKIGTPYIQPSRYDGGTLDDKIAELYTYVPIQFNCGIRDMLSRIFPFLKKEKTNRVDIGFNKVLKLDDAAIEVLDIGSIKGKRRGRIGEVAVKSGATSEYTEGKLVDNDWYGNVGYGHRTAWFGPCGLISGYRFALGGDSSSLIVWKKDNYLGGFLFAGSDISTVFCHYEYVEQDLGVELIVSK